MKNFPGTCQFKLFENDKQPHIGKEFYDILFLSYKNKKLGPNNSGRKPSASVQQRGNQIYFCLYDTTLTLDN